MGLWIRGLLGWHATVHSIMLALFRVARPTTPSFASCDFRFPFVAAVDSALRSCLVLHRLRQLSASCRVPLLPCDLGHGCLERAWSVSAQGRAKPWCGIRGWLGKRNDAFGRVD